MRSRRSPLASHTHHSSTTLRQLFARGWWRRMLCLVLIFAMLVLPDTGYIVSATSSLAVQVAKDTVAPVPVAVDWFRRLFVSKATPGQETEDDRNARVRHIRVSPGRFVGYIGEIVNFAAMGIDANGQSAHGAKFDWRTDDANKVQIDDAGRATLLSPGLVRITCRVGTIEASAHILIRPVRRPCKPTSNGASIRNLCHLSLPTVSAWFSAHHQCLRTCCRRRRLKGIRPAIMVMMV